MAPRLPDAVKGKIAESIHTGLLPTSLVRYLQDECEVVDVEVHDISPTEWQYRVKTKRNGTRYFALKLREMM